MKMEKKDYPKVYLEEWKYKIKKIPGIIDAELVSDDSDDSDSE